MPAPKMRQDKYLRELGDILKECDSEYKWVDYIVEVDEDCYGRIPTVRYDVLTITVTLPKMMSWAPFEVLKEMFTQVFDTINGKIPLYTLGPKTREYLHSIPFKRDIRALLRRDRRYDLTKEPDAVMMNTLRAAKKMAVNAGFRKEDLSRITVMWSDPECKPMEFSAVTYPYIGMVVVDRNLGPNLTAELAYAVYHEMCVVLAFSEDRDKLNRRHFRQLLSEYRGWDIMEQSCLIKGMRFNHTAIKMEESLRW